MRRLTILLATAAALMLVPAAQAFGAVEIDIKGIEGGSGEVSSAGGYEGSGFYEGSPTLECSGPPAVGICETTPSDEGEEIYGVYMSATPGPGSVVKAWESEKGGVLQGEICGGGAKTECFAVAFAEAEEVEIVVTFECVEPVACAGGPEGPELTVTKEGTGSGTVVSNPAGIECGATCGAQFEEGSKVTLTASPAAGSLFRSWKGCETGGVNGRQCTVTMDKAKTVVAKFITAYDVTVNRVGTGLGKVSSSPGGVLCLSNCSSTTAAFKEGTSVTLNAAPTKNFVFTEWTGDCSGSGPCSLGALGEDKEVGAKFTEVAKVNLTLTKSGGGQGSVKGKPAGINCGFTCTTQAAAYYEGAEVELTVAAGKGSSFGGWSTGSGTCTGTTNPCKVTMSAAKAVTAEFK